MAKKQIWAACAVVGAAVILVGYGLQADEFTDEDVARWQGEFMSVVADGQSLWGSPDLGTNGVACGQCHPNAANTHPETYPKFQQQLGGVVAFRDMINWCIMNPLEGQKLALDDDQMIALAQHDGVGLGLKR